jgi:hypothetical protein
MTVNHIGSSVHEIAKSLCNIPSAMTQLRVLKTISFAFASQNRDRMAVIREDTPEAGHKAGNPARNRRRIGREQSHFGHA